MALDTILPLLEEAERRLLDGDLDQAAVLYGAALELDRGRSPLSEVGLARVALLLGRRAEAARLVERALAIHPTSVEALTIRGAVEESGGDLRQALDTYQQACAQPCGYGPAHANRGRVLAQLGRWQEAALALDQAAGLAPGLALAPMRASAHLALGHVDQALAILRARLEEAPDDLDALVTLVDALASLDSLQLASELVVEGLRRLPGAAVLHARRSSLALRRGDLPGAREAVARQLTLGPDDLEAVLYAAALDLMGLDLAAAAEKAQRALALEPACWRAHQLLGIVFQGLRLRPAALAATLTAAALASPSADGHLGPKAAEPGPNLVGPAPA